MTEETNPTPGVADAEQSPSAEAHVDIHTLALAVLALMKHGLRLERERLGPSTFTLV